MSGAAWVWSAGIALVPYVLVLAAACGMRLGRPLVLVVVVLGFALAVRFTQRPREVPPRSRSPIDRLWLAGIAVAAALVVWVSATTPLVAIDARAIWSYHARIILDTGRYPAPELADPGLVVQHPRYPPLLPMAEAATGFLAGSSDDRVLRLVPTVFFLALVALLLGELPRRDPRFGFSLVGIYVLMPTLLLSRTAGADAGLADIALSLYVALSVLSLEAGEDAQAGAFAAAAALTKNEGLVLGALLMLSAWLRGRRSRRGSVIFTLAFALPLLPWMLIQQQIANSYDEHYLQRLAAGALGPALARLPGLLLEMLRLGLFAPQRDVVFWWIVLVFWWASKRRSEVLTQGRLWIVPAYLMAVWLVYGLSPWSGVVQVQASMTRILLHVAPLALLGLTCSPRWPDNP